MKDNSDGLTTPSMVQNEKSMEQDICLNRQGGGVGLYEPRDGVCVCGGQSCYEG